LYSRIKSAFSKTTEEKGTSTDTQLFPVPSTDEFHLEDATPLDKSPPPEDTIIPLPPIEDKEKIDQKLSSDNAAKGVDSQSKDEKSGKDKTGRYKIDDKLSVI